MSAFLSWYLLVSLLGLLTFPLAWRLFPALADRGYSLSRALGLLLWGFVFWLMVSLGIIQNDGGGLGLSLVLVLGLSGWAFWKTIVNRKSSIVNWLHSNRRVVIATEVLFFLAFAAWAFVRASNPEITSAGGEKTMELAFINAIMRSPTFPPHDPWLSGYAISYYYFGYVMTAMLAEVTGTAGSVAHNLMLALVFALSAVGAYGILYNLLAAWQATKNKGRTTEESSSVVGRPSIRLPLLGPFFLLIVSNLEGFLEVLHNYGLFWPSSAQRFNFWVWLDILNLNQAPAQVSGWMPRFYWWWRASRVVQDFDLAGRPIEIIDEFPFFSYLLGDLHPHVLAMPFGLLAVALALNIFLGGWDADNRLHLQWKGVLCAALVLGGLAFLNTWDILGFTALMLGAFLLRRIRQRGWKWVRLEELLTFAIPLGVISLLLYLPFYFGFSSQAGGILPNLVSPTRGVHLWVMFGSLFIPLFVYLFHLRRAEGGTPRWLASLAISAGGILLLWGFSWLLGWIAWLRLPEVAENYLESQGVETPLALFLGAGQERLASIGGLLTLFLLIGLTLAYLFRRADSARVADEDSSSIVHPPSSFVLLLILLAGLLVLAPEFVFIRDNFGNRMNTVFKFYYQGWEMWSLAAAFGVAVLFLELRRVRDWLACFVPVALVVLMALFYPVLGLATKTNNFQIPAFRQALVIARESSDPTPFRTAARVWTLDGAVQFEREYPDDALAVRWLQSAPMGVIVEAVSPTNGASYQDFAHISTYSGLPTVMGWEGHEGQWRGSYEGYAQRKDDIRRLYETNSWDEARAILEKYDIRYVYVGTLERSTYRVNEIKFQQFLQPVYQGGGVVIYAAP
jgi:YYY domain-containing protein